MEAIGGRAPTGRHMAGPCSDLAELVDGDGLKHVALVFHDRWKDDPSLGSPMDPIRGLMAKTGVIGLPSLVDVRGGAWVYATGTAWSVAEIVRALAAAGEKGSVRAGLELCYLAAEVLLEAADIGAGIGVTRHGSLDPMRLLVRNDGQVLVIGYGLPPVDLQAWLENPRTPIDEDSLRYLPPERFHGRADLSSDLFALTLIGLEMMVGRPVYDGLFDDIAAQAKNGDAVRRVYGWRDALPATVQEALLRALKPDPDARYRDGVEYLYAVHDLLSSIDADGPPLVEVVARYRGLTARDRLASAKATGSYSVEELAELTADLDALDAPSLQAPSRARPDAEPEEAADEVEEEAEPERWTRVSRGAETAPERPRRAGGAREDLRSRLQRDRPRAAPQGADVPEEEDDSSDARSRLRRRLRERSAPSDESPGRPRPRRRVRDLRGGDDESAEVGEQEVEEVDDEPAEEAAPAPEPAPEPVAEPVSEPSSAAASAAALLERLRGTTARSSVPPAPEPGPEKAPAQPVATAPVREAPAPEPEDALEPEPETVVHAPVFDEDAPTPERARDLAAAVPTGEIVAVRAPDGRRVDLPVGPGLADRAVAALGLDTVDLTGRRVRGWRLAGGSLEAVGNATRVREIRVPNLGAGPDHRFSAPVGDAVRVHEIVAHLVTWLDLEDASWVLVVDGLVADPDALLADLGDGTLELDLDEEA